MVVQKPIALPSASIAASRMLLAVQKRRAANNKRLLSAKASLHFMSDCVDRAKD